ncbi:MAG: 3-isopropylmalate dehydratase small subunit [Myxococcales bacterium]|nr:3-isopropylmalate dehydratase small subunit [Myxococcales bacterium]
MTRTPLLRISSPILVLPRAHIDTDQIVPARFLTTTERDGLGEAAFADWRDQPPFGDPRVRDCRILVAGENFGCGSSREHAPWALLALGIQAVISTSFADIFRTNAHKNGLLTVELDAGPHAELMACPWSDVEIDVPGGTVVAAGRTSPFRLDGFARHCLIEGVDELDVLLGYHAAITAHEARP